MNRPVDPDLDDNPRIPAEWGRTEVVRELQKERRRCAEEMTENRNLRKQVEAAHKALTICDGAMMGKVNPKSTAFKVIGEILRPENAPGHALVDATTGKPCPTRGNLLCTIPDKDHRHTSACIWAARQGDSPDGPEILGHVVRSYRSASSENVPAEAGSASPPASGSR